MDHQSRALELCQEPRLLIEAPTGGGKTWTGAAPLVNALDEGEGAVFVYPTNALAEDQTVSLLELVRRAGKPAAQVRADGTLEGDANPHVMIWRVTADTLEDAAEGVGGKWRGETFARVLEKLPNRPLWLVTNPDTLYLLCIARYSYSPQIWSRLTVCRTLIFDEFHLYRGPSLVRALVLLELARALMGLERVRVLSATLPASLRLMLEQRFQFKTISAIPSAEGRMVQHPVILCVRATPANERTDQIALHIQSELEKLRAERTTCLPMVVLRQSVIAAIHLEDMLANNGMEHAEIGVYRGLSSKAIRSMVNKTLVLGTSALEVGVDFKTPRLVFEATSASSFAQRFGRVGRHSSGSATFFTEERVKHALEQLVPACSRDALLAVMSVVSETDDAVGDNFALSPWGGAVRKAAFAALRQRGKANNAGERFDERVQEADEQLQVALGNVSRPGLMSRAAQSRLVESVGFRGGSGSVEVFDVREKQRRSDPALAAYDVDLATFYSRAMWKEKGNSRRPTVVGYAGKRRRLSLNLRLETSALFGIHAPSGEAIELRVDGDATAWETLLIERKHLVGIFPRSLRDQLSWRETVFESLDDRIALIDDDALIAGYLYAPDGRAR